MTQFRTGSAAIGSTDAAWRDGSDEVFASPVDENAAAAWQMLARMLPTANLTLEALSGQLEPAVEWDRGADTPDVYDRLARVLYRRRKQHVLVTGLQGVGKTTVVREFARRAALGEIPFLKHHEFLWIDCRNVGPEDSRACLETILTACEGRPRVVVCLDGLDALLKRPHGGTNKPLLCAACEREGVQIIGTLSRWAYNDLAAGDSLLLDRFTRVELDEPSEEVARRIARQASRSLEGQYDVRIADDVVERSVALTSTYMLGRSHPHKAIRVLECACDEADYERTQGREPQGAIEIADVVRVLA
ncbi:MAG: AAA family ATPase, partial [Planctomycetes bacterium]|nr:AAA family ATPase [Planctomycetota bacterium]